MAWLSISGCIGARSVEGEDVLFPVWQRRGREKPHCVDCPLKLRPRNQCGRALLDGLRRAIRLERYAETATDEAEVAMMAARWPLS